MEDAGDSLSLVKTDDQVWLLITATRSSPFSLYHLFIFTTLRKELLLPFTTEEPWLQRLTCPRPSAINKALGLGHVLNHEAILIPLPHPPKHR